ncbi:hypothetical protein CCZ01_04275 [Helicobacter monodelphidis]|uniref:HMA2 domain-containing protein n=1 Tax=Helicobacter sp. 15-1451 TaxID=2004995 RepID=UPI000DCDD44C|nr:hypothetical protein [Helicobacter sp. 15-1451]RAX58030.1 hypothetical protein CCZ01_04275 [Helicobacter sp. 15-1451]
MDIDKELLEKVADYFTIVHHTPGRIRLRASAALKAEFGGGAGNVETILEAIKNIPIIKNIKLNLLIGSVVVEYDAKQFNPSLWESWLRKEHLDEVMSLFSGAIEK